MTTRNVTSPSRHQRTIEQDRASWLIWSITLAVTLLSSVSSVRAGTGSGQAVSGKKASLALLESPIENHSGHFCAARRSKLRLRLDAEGAVVTTLTDERDVPEAHVLRVARRLRANESVMVVYCEGTGENLTTTGVAVAHAVWKQETRWTGEVVKTGKPGAAKDLAVKDTLTKAQVARTLAETSRRMNVSLPRMLDKSLRIDSTSSENQTLVANYTLLDELVPAANADGFWSAVRADLVSAACNDKESRALLRNGARFGYRYHGEDGKEIATLVVKSSDCLVAPRNHSER